MPFDKNGNWIPPAGEPTVIPYGASFQNGKIVPPQKAPASKAPSAPPPAAPAPKAGGGLSGFLHAVGSALGSFANSLIHRPPTALESGAMQAQSQAAAAPYADLISRSAQQAGIPASVLAGLLEQESGFNPKAVSKTGDYGIAQINRSAHPGVSPEQAQNPAFAIPWAANYLGSLVKRYGSLEAALSAYNTGSPTSPVGKKYAQAVLSRAQKYSGLEAPKPAPALASSATVATPPPPPFRRQPLAFAPGDSLAPAPAAAIKPYEPSTAQRILNVLRGLDQSVKRGAEQLIGGAMESFMVPELLSSLYRATSRGANVAPEFQQEFQAPGSPEFWRAPQPSNVAEQALRGLGSMAAFLVPTGAGEGAAELAARGIARVAPRLVGTAAERAVQGAASAAAEGMAIQSARSLVGALTTPSEQNPGQMARDILATGGQFAVFGVAGQTVGQAVRGQAGRLLQSALEQGKLPQALYRATVNATGGAATGAVVSALNTALQALRDPKQFDRHAAAGDMAYQMLFFGGMDFIMGMLGAASTNVRSTGQTGEENRYTFVSGTLDPTKQGLREFKPGSGLWVDETGSPRLFEMVPTQDGGLVRKYDLWREAQLAAAQARAAQAGAPESVAQPAAVPSGPVAALGPGAQAEASQTAAPVEAAVAPETAHGAGRAHVAPEEAAQTTAPAGATPAKAEAAAPPVRSGAEIAALAGVKPEDNIGAALMKVQVRSLAPPAGRALGPEIVQAAQVLFRAYSNGRLDNLIAGGLTAPRVMEALPAMAGEGVRDEKQVAEWLARWLGAEPGAVHPQARPGQMPRTGEELAQLVPVEEGKTAEETLGLLAGMARPYADLLPAEFGKAASALRRALVEGDVDGAALEQMPRLRFYDLVVEASQDGIRTSPQAAAWLRRRLGGNVRPEAQTPEPSPASGEETKAGAAPATGSQEATAEAPVSTELRLQSAVAPRVRTPAEEQARQRLYQQPEVQAAIREAQQGAASPEETVLRLQARIEDLSARIAEEYGEGTVEELESSAVFPDENGQVYTPPEAPAELPELRTLFYARDALLEPVREAHAANVSLLAEALRARGVLDDVLDAKKTSDAAEIAQKALGRSSVENRLGTAEFRPSGVTIALHGGGEARSMTWRQAVEHLRAWRGHIEDALAYAGAQRAVRVGAEAPKAPEVAQETPGRKAQERHREAERPAPAPSSQAREGAVRPREGEHLTVTFTSEWGSVKPGTAYTGTVEKVFRAGRAVLVRMKTDDGHTAVVPVSKYVEWSRPAERPTAEPAPSTEAAAAKTAPEEAKAPAFGSAWDLLRKARVNTNTTVSGRATLLYLSVSRRIPEAYRDVAAGLRRIVEDELTPAQQSRLTASQAAEWVLQAVQDGADSEASARDWWARTQPLWTEEWIQGPAAPAVTEPEAAPEQASGEGEIQPAPARGEPEAPEPRRHDVDIRDRESLGILLENPHLLDRIASVRVTRGVKVGREELARLEELFQGWDVRAVPNGVEFARPEDAAVARAVEALYARIGEGGQREQAQAKQLARDILNSLGRVSGEGLSADRPRRAGGISRIGVGIRADLIRQGYVDLRGKKVRSPKDLATVAQVFRDPRFETLRIFYTDDDGRVLGYDALTSRLPDAAMLPAERARWAARVRRRAERLGASQTWILHNHPSGDPQPSDSDVAFTRFVARLLPGRFRGHVVIDSDRYAFIDPNGHVREGSVPERARREELLQPSLDHPVLGVRLLGQKDLYALGRALKTDPSLAVMVYAGSKLDIRALEEVPVRFLLRPDQAEGYIRNRAREYGAPNVFLVASAGAIGRPPVAGLGDAERAALHAAVRDWMRRSVLRDALVADEMAAASYWIDVARRKDYALGRPELSYAPRVREGEELDLADYFLRSRGLKPVAEEVPSEAKTSRGPAQMTTAAPVQRVRAGGKARLDFRDLLRQLEGEGVLVRGASPGERVQGHGAEVVEGRAPEDVRRPGEARPAGEGAPGGGGERAGAADEGAGLGHGLLQRGGAGPDDVHLAPERGGHAGAGLRPERVAGPERRDLTEPGGRNYRITPEDEAAILEGGAVARFARNLDAIRVLRQLEAEQRPPTKDEQSVLARYTGWGALPDVFGSYERAWRERAEELKKLVTPEEYAAARASTLNAHYTSFPVVRAIWQAIQAMGFREGRVLEPAAGVGNFIGAAPRDVRARWTAVELDKLTGRILRALYPRADVRIQGFQDTDLPNGFFDLAVSNVPFGDYGVADRTYEKSGMARSIHNYFFAKTLDKVRPGGIVAFLTSRYTSDARSDYARRYIADRADLLTAVRLPGTAFEANAGTRVVTDLLILRRRAPGEAPSARTLEWVRASETKLPNERWTDVTSTATVNDFFLHHPDHVLGSMAVGRGLYTAEELVVRAPEDGQDPEAIGQKLAKLLLKDLPEGAYQPAPSRDAELRAPEKLVPAPEDLRPDAFTVRGGKLYQNKRGSLVPAALTGKDAEIMRGLVPIRDAARELLHLEYTGAPEQKVSAARQRLNTLYDEFVSRFGPLHDRTVKRVLLEEPDAALLLALENWDEERKAATKADIFTRPAVRPMVAPDHVESASDALALSLQHRGRVDMAYMQNLTGKSEEDLVHELSGQIFLDPEDGWRTADDYLSGPVRGKLRVAEGAAQSDPRYTANVEALRAVQPRDRAPDEIDMRLGSAWLPEGAVDAFLRETIFQPISFYLPNEPLVRYVPATSRWVLERSRWMNDEAVEMRWGSQGIQMTDLLEHALNNRDPVVTKVIGHGDNAVRVVDPAKTEAAREAVERLHEEFARWARGHERWAAELSRIYNDTFNDMAPRRFDGSHLQFPGLAPSFVPREHQRNVVWRAISTGRVLAHHAVGAGKTAEGIITAMEWRRLGLHKKVAVVVPNHMVGEWQQQWMRLYPGARILVPDKADYAPARRAELTNRIATGDWDAIIIPESSFIRLPMSAQTVQEWMERQLQAYRSWIEANKGGKGDSRAVKEVEKQMQRFETRIKRRIKAIGELQQRNVLPFEQLGIDGLIVDEAHRFKNLMYWTRLNRVAGLGSTDGSDRAFDLFMKTQYLHQLNGEHPGLLFLTGTPVSNTLAETWIMQRYLIPDVLAEKGLETFDAWVSTFAKVTAQLELAPSGTNYRTVQRLSEYSNLPELQLLWSSFADTRTTAQLVADGLLKLPRVKRTIIEIDASPDVRAYMEDLAMRAESVSQKDPSEDNMLKITTDGRMVAVDPRLRIPDAADDPGNKINVAAREIYKRWKAWEKDRSTIIAFLDIGTPRSRPARAEEDEEAAAAAAPEAKEQFVVYDDLVKKLVAMGIPHEEIAVIHDYPKDSDKVALADQMNDGRIRILLGSTEKMGVGLNVQRLARALVDIDVPWRPADLDQRHGRLVRQGNLNDEVEIIHLVTKPSLDARLWQIVESKAKWLDQFLAGSADPDTIGAAGDFGTTQLAAGEVKAAAVGDPRLAEIANLQNKLTRLSHLRRAWEEQQWEAQRAVASLPAEIEHLRQQAEALAEDAGHLPPGGDAFRMVVDGKAFTDRAEAGQALDRAERAAHGKEPEQIGSYGEFAIWSTRNPTYVELRRKSSTMVQLLPEGRSTIHRIDAYLAALARRADATRARVDELERALQAAKERRGQPFEHEAEYQSTRSELDRLVNELGLLQQSVNPVLDEGSGSEDEALALPPSAAEEGIPHLTPETTRRVASILSDRLGVVMRSGRTAPGRAGEYRPTAGAGAVKPHRAEDWRTIGHELGHALLHRTDFQPSPQEMARVADELYPRPVARDKKTSEGFAEWFRVWVSSPERARELAPETTDIFEKMVEADPQLADVFNTVRLAVDADLAGTPIGRALGVTADIGERTPAYGPEYEVGAGKPALLRFADRLLFSIADRALPFRDIMRELEAGGERLTFDLVDLDAVAGSARQRALRWFTDRPRDLAGRFVADGASLQEIRDQGLRAIREALRNGARFTGPQGEEAGAMRIFDAIIKALRFQERAERGFETPMTPEEAEAVLEQARTLFPGAVEAAERLTEQFSRIVLEQLERGGVIDAETRARVEAGSKHYVPIYYVHERTGAGAGRPRRGGQQPVHRYRGGRGRTLSFQDAMILKLSQVAEAVEFNRMMNTLEEALRKPDMGAFGVIEHQPLAHQAIAAEEAAKAINRLLGEQALDPRDLAGKVLSIFTPRGLGGLAPEEPVLASRHGSKVVLMRVAPDIFRAVQAMTPVQLDMAAKTLALATRVARAGALTRMRTAINLVARDFGAALIQTRSNRPLKSVVEMYLRGGAAALGLDPKLRELYEQTGGYGGTAGELLSEIGRAAKDDGLAPTPVEGLKRLGNAFVWVVRLPSEALRVIEETPRVGAYVDEFMRQVAARGEDGRAALRALKEGRLDDIPASIRDELEQVVLQAAVASRELTVNFSRGGVSEAARRYERVVPFLHGSVQGMYRAAMEVRSHPGRVLLRMALFMVPMTVLSWLAMENASPNRYEDLPSRARDTYWFFPVPGHPEMMVAIAKEYSYSVPINMLERFLDWVGGQTAERRKPLEDAWDVVKQSFGLNLLPSALSLFIDLRSNRTSLGSPIVPQAQQGLAKDLQVAPNSTALARWVTWAAEQLGLPQSWTPAPRQVDYALQQGFGVFTDLADFARWVSGDASRLAGAEYAPVVGSLLYGYAEQGSRITDRFYADYGRAQMLSSSAKRWAEGQQRPGMRITEKEVRLVRALPALTSIANDLSAIRKLQDRPGLTPEQRRKVALQVAYAQRVGAGLLYGVDPPPPPAGAGLPANAGQLLSQWFASRAAAAMDREKRTKGGATENANYLESLQR